MTQQQLLTSAVAPKKASKKRKKESLRSITDPFVVAAPTGSSIRTSLHLTADEERVVRLVCEHLGHLSRSDLALLCWFARKQKKVLYDHHFYTAERKQFLTSDCSSRWANSITRSNDAMWQLQLRNMWRELADKKGAIRTIRRRLAIPVGSKGAYADLDVVKQKRRRLQVLESRVATLERYIEDYDVGVCYGGKKLARKRHNLEEAGITEQQWREQWEAARLFCTAQGDKQYEYGNGLISVNPDTGMCEITLPAPLKHLANAPRGRYRLSKPVKFKQRDLVNKWAAQVVNGSVAYKIMYNADKRRWYMDASWSIEPRSLPTLETLKQRPSIGIDLNGDHLACWIVNSDGNPVGDPITLEYMQEGSAATRDGRLRAIITQILDLAQAHKCGSVTIENLNFDQERAIGRDNPKHKQGSAGKRFRKTVFGIPYAKFRDRLSGMAYNRNIAIIAVDPAYTSKWGQEHWYQHLNQTRDHKSSTHHAAALVIARRGQRHSAKCRSRQNASAHQREPSQQSMVSQPRKQLSDGSTLVRVGKTTPLFTIPRSAETRPTNLATVRESINSATLSMRNAEASHRKTDNGRRAEPFGHLPCHQASDRISPKIERCD